MEAARALTPSELSEFLLNVAPVRPVFIWDRPGSANRRWSTASRAPSAWSASPCSARSSRPKILSACRRSRMGSRAFGRRRRSRAKSLCAVSRRAERLQPGSQKAFYSLINDRRIGEYRLPPGSVVIGAGNRAQDAAIVKPMSSALINRMAHVQLRASPTDWLAWAGEAAIHPLANRLYSPAPGSSLVKAAKARGAVLHAPRLAHLVGRDAGPMTRRR